MTYYVPDCVVQMKLLLNGGVVVDPAAHPGVILMATTKYVDDKIAAAQFGQGSNLVDGGTF